MIGNDGLSAAVIKETEMALSAHELIKIRVLGDDREQREHIFHALADQLNAAPIQHIGKLLILWRPAAENTKKTDQERKPGPREMKVLKYSSRGGQRPDGADARLGRQVLELWVLHATRTARPLIAQVLPDHGTSAVTGQSGECVLCGKGGSRGCTDSFVDR